MAKVSTYLNFARSTEEAFLFYQSVFGGEFSTPIQRFKDIPQHPDQPPLAEADKNLVMHVALPILGGHVLMGTDAPESMGFSVKQGNIVLKQNNYLQRFRLGQKLKCHCKKCFGGLLRQPD